MDTSKWPLPGRSNEREPVNAWALGTRAASRGENLLRILKSSTFFPLSVVELHEALPLELRFDPFDAASFEAFVRSNVHGVMTHVLDPESGHVFFSLPRTEPSDLSVGPFAQRSSLLFLNGLAPLVPPGLIRESLLFPTIGGMSPPTSARTDAEWGPCELCNYQRRTSRACDMCGNLDLSPADSPLGGALATTSTLSPAATSPFIFGKTLEPDKDTESEPTTSGDDDEDGERVSSRRRLNFVEVVNNGGEGTAANASANALRVEGRSAKSSQSLELDSRIYCKGFPEGTPMHLLIKHVNMGLCRALGSTPAAEDSEEGMSYIRGALPLVTSVTACLLVFDSPQLARAALALDDSLLFGESRLTLKRPQGWRDDDFPNPLPPLRVTVVREEAGSGIDTHSTTATASATSTTTTTIAAVPRRSAPAPSPLPSQSVSQGSGRSTQVPSQPVSQGPFSFESGAPAGLKAVKKKKAVALIPATGSKSDGGSVGGGGVADPMMTALTPIERARVSRVRSQLKRGDLECLEQLCSRDKGGMMHVEYGHLLVVLGALQSEGFLKFQQRPTCTLIVSYARESVQRGRISPRVQGCLTPLPPPPLPPPQSFLELLVK